MRKCDLFSLSFCSALLFSTTSATAESVTVSMSGTIVRSNCEYYSGTYGNFTINTSSISAGSDDVTLEYGWERDATTWLMFDTVEMTGNQRGEWNTSFGKTLHMRSTSASPLTGINFRLKVGEQVYPKDGFWRAEFKDYDFPCERGRPVRFSVEKVED